MSATVQRLFAPDGAREPEPLAVLSHGKGQQSTALGYMLHYDPAVRRRYAPGRLITLTSSTSNEHPETDDHARYLASFYAAVGEHFEEITPDMGYHTEAWTILEHHYASRNNIGSKSFRRSCTDNLKIKPTYKRLENILSTDYGVSLGDKRGLYEYVELVGEKISVMIGFTAEELDRRLNPDEKIPKWMQECVRRTYPLADLGMTREDCEDYIRSLGHPPVYPSWCRFCPFETPFDVFYQATFSPEDHDRWVELENNKLRAWAGKLPPEKNHGVFPGKTLGRVLDEAREEFGHMTETQMHERRMAGHGVSSRY